MARVLVIDDDEASRGIVREMLENAGHEVSESETSDDGIAAYKLHSPDLVITDLFMPEKGGLDVIGKLVGADPDARVIAISGIELREKLDIFQLAKQLGALNTLAKPLEPKLLLNAVADALGEN